MDKRFWLSTVVVAVASMVLGAVGYGVLFGADFAALPQLFRSDEECARRMPWMILGQFLTAGALVWLYQKGREEKPWLGQGLRFGVAVAVLLNVGQFLMAYVLQPFPGVFTAQQIAIGSMISVVLGVLVAWLERT